MLLVAYVPPILLHLLKLAPTRLQAELMFMSAQSQGCRTSLMAFAMPCRDEMSTVLTLCTIGLRHRVLRRNTLH